MGHASGRPAHHSNPMTIARRLMILLAVPLLIRIGIGIITRQQMARIDERTRFVAESRVVALARLGDISRTFAELRVKVRSFLLAADEPARAAAGKAYDADRVELDRLLVDYADHRTTTAQGRRLLEDFRTMSREWLVGADQVMSLASTGRKDEAIALLLGPLAETAHKVGKISSEWIKFNENAATHAGHIAVAAIRSCSSATCASAWTRASRSPCTSTPTKPTPPTSATARRGSSTASSTRTKDGACALKKAGQTSTYALVARHSSAVRT
jgi:CHASE3 domain sensor protein